jgi:hemerythrin superfamily protein
MESSLAKTQAGIFYETDADYMDHPHNDKQPNGLQYIRDDHSHLRSLYDRYHQECDMAKKIAISERMMKNITMHASAEERFMYPELKKVPNGGYALYERGVLDDQTIKDTMYFLENHKKQSDKGTMDWKIYDATVNKLITITSEHMDVEESMFLAPLDKVLTDKEKEEMQNNLVWGKKHGHTHPHPEVPASDSFITHVTHPVVAAGDRAIDMLKGNRFPAQEAA